MYEDLKETTFKIEDAFRRLNDIVRVLRSECPWDREQTHESLRGCLLEEAYETADAIDRGDMKNLCEELGDVLLQIVFHGILGEESGAFDTTRIINEECEKMIRRHPHVFLRETAKSVDKVVEKWENIKVGEGGESSYTKRLSQVPRALPALVRSYKVQEKAARSGFDWEDVSGALGKMAEETGELAESYHNAEGKQRVSEEMGDVLFSVVNIARFLDVEPESALNMATEKFVRRFSYIESEATKQGRILEDMTLAEMDCLWEEAKQKEVSR